MVSVCNRSRIPVARDNIGRHKYVRELITHYDVKDEENLLCVLKQTHLGHVYMNIINSYDKI